MPGFELPGLLEHGARLGRVAEREVLLHRQRIDVALQAAVQHQRLQLGAEDQPTVVKHGVMHGLDAQAVASHEELLARAVPQRKREHAAQPCHAVRAPGPPGVDDDLGVALGAEGQAQALQLRHQLAVVVDLAVEDDDDAAVGTVQRLLAGGDVDDGQPPVAEAQARLDVQAAFIRAAMVLRVVHAPEHDGVGLALAARVEEAGDATHGVGPFVAGR